MKSQLPAKLLKKPFSYRDAIMDGLSQYALNCHIRNGIIERIARGVYQAMGTDSNEEKQFQQASKIVGKPSAICLLSAISYYDLTDTIPDKLWIMVPKEKRISNKSIKLYRARNPNWTIGIIKENGFTITSIERTIIDCLTLKNIIPTRIGVEALKKAITQNKTNLSKLIAIAKKLNVLHRVITYFEVLA